MAKNTDTSAPVRVLLVDDFAPFRQVIRSMLKKRPELQVVGEASDGLEAVQKAEELQPDLILLDIGLPKQNGIEAARRIRKLAPECKILFVSQESSADVVQEALSLGAAGYVLKTQAASDLLTAVETVLQGKRFVSAGLASSNVTDDQAPDPLLTQSMRISKGTPEHEQYKALCALAAGGLLEGAELGDFQAHLKECSECRSDYEELSNLVTRDVPQAQGTLRQKLAAMRAKPLPYSRQRFLRRARAEGVIFSREVETPARSGPWYFRPLTLAPVAFLVVVAVSLVAYHFRKTPDTARVKDASVAQRIAELERQNSALTASLSQLNESLAAGQREIQNLRVQLGNATATTEKLRQAQGEAEAERSSSQNAQLLEETRNQEKLLAKARDEAARINQLRVNDEASLVVQQTRITELSNKLRIASATLDQERQLAAAGKDVRELMAARQLHVVDVHDTDPNGHPTKAFGRVFLTEGKSLTFYAFDLSEDRVVNAKRSFQVWAVPEASKNSARSLGFLHVDAKAPGRWVLRVENPALVKEINSVFVTVEPAAGGKQPSGEKMLYAYLGEPNHP